MSKVIEKKILSQYFKDVVNRSKTFELRKDEDDIQCGDTLVLKEWDGERYTGNQEARLVTYVLRNAVEYGLMDGYCIVGMADKENEAEKQKTFDNVMSTAEVSEFLHVSRQTINTWQRLGLLIPFKPLKSGNIYYKPDVIAFRDKNMGWSLKRGWNKS